VDSYLNSESTRKFAAGIAYLGRGYIGWQTQMKAPAKPSIQEMVEEVFHSILSEKTRVVASGRTDAGVNAIEQVVHFRVHQMKFTPEILVNAFNSRLPKDIRVLWVKQVSQDFHAQRSAIKKQYSFFYLHGPVYLPEWQNRAVWMRHQLDVPKMHEAVQTLVGEHDFKVFQASGADPKKSTVRTIFEADCTSLPLSEFPLFTRDDYCLTRIRLVGSGFLKQMVRSIAGTLREIGENKRPVTNFIDLMQSQNRQALGTTAQPDGLWLERVWYP